jgi:membrane protease YdiL (CAAX protease family)
VQRDTAARTRLISAQRDSAPQSRWWSVVQIIALLGTMEGALWSQGRNQARWYLAAVVVLVASVLLSHPRSRELGLGWRGFKGASWIVPLAAVVCGFGVLLAYQFGTLTVLYGERTPYWHAALYIVWALEQQFILNSFFYKRFESLIGDTTFAVVITALLFSLMHIPNPVLMPATFLGGILFVETFRRWRNIYPIALAHAMFGLTLAITVPDTWIHHMRVGLGFLRFKMHG